MDNLGFFKNNVEFYSEEYRDYTLKPWERRLVELVVGPEVLDVACGGGRITVPLLRRGFNVTGMDFVGEFEGKVREHESEFKGNFKFDEADMTDLPYADCSFDTVTCVNSLVYLRNIEEVYMTISEISRVLKLGGRMLITTWNILHPYWGASVVLNYLIRRSERFGGTSPFFATDGRIAKSPTHMYVPSRRTLNRICQECGIASCIVTGREKGLLALFHPILVIVGEKGGVG